MDAKCSNKLTYLSFILAVGIIIRHSSCVSYQSLSNVHLWIERFVNDATDMIVPMFFAISGFLFFKNFDFSKLAHKWISRIHSLLIPFVIWSFAGFLFFFLIGKIPFIASNTDMVPNNLEVGTLLKDIFINTKYNTTWFVLNLMIYVVVVPFFKPLIDKKLTGGGILLVITLLGYYLGSSKILYAVPYIFGAYMALNYQQVVLRRYDKKLVLCAGIFLLITFLCQTVFELPQGPKMIPYRLLQIVLLWVLADNLAIERVPKWWMKISFFIYVTHSMILESVEKLFWLGLGDRPFGAILDHFFAPMITLCLIIVIAFFMKKYLPRCWRVVSGGRG